MGQDTMRLTVAENLYTVTNAELTAYVKDPVSSDASPSDSLKSGLFWDLEVNVRDQWINFWSYGFHSPNVRRWTDLVGHGISQNTPINPVTGEMDWGWYGGNLISAHLEILQGKLRFIETDECKLRLQWEGICSGAPLGCKPLPDERLHFAIDCWCVFKEVRAANRDVLSPFLDVSDFDESVQEYATGNLSMFKPRC